MSDALFIGAGLVDFTTVGATDSADPAIPEACGGLFGDEIRRDVWFEYRAGRTGQTTVSTCPSAAEGVGSEFDTIIVVRDPATLAVLACNDEGPGCGGYAVVQFAAVAGARYLLQIGGHDEYIGIGRMLVAETGAPAAPPANDLCSGATALAVGQPAPFDLLGAGRHGDQCGDAMDDQWFAVPAQKEAGKFRLAACGADGVVRLEAIRGSCGDQSICGAAAGCGDGASLEVEVAAGVPLRVRLAGTSRGVGTIAVEFEPSPDCPADLTRDGQVGADDMSLLLAGWGTAAVDIDGDGEGAAADLSLLLQSWGACD